MTLPKLVAQVLGQWRSAQAARGIGTADTALIFPGDKGGPLRNDEVRDVFVDFAEGAGVAGAVPYSLRHGYRNMLEHELPPHIVSLLLGQLQDGSEASQYGLNRLPPERTEGAAVIDAEFPRRDPSPVVVSQPRRGFHMPT